VTDGALEWADMGEVYDTLDFAGERFPLRAGTEHLRADLHEWFPEERAAIDRYLELVRAANKRGQLYFMEKALPGPLAAVAGPLLRASALRAARKTTLEVLEGLTKDPRLIGVLTGQWGDYGLPPSRGSFFMHAAVAAHYLRGAAYPVGGASRIAETIEPLITREGGAVVTNAEVRSILIEGGRAAGVQLADGRELRAPLVVSDAGVALTFGRLLAPEDAARCGFRGFDATVPPSGAHVSLYLGFDQSAAALGLPKSNLWLFPGYDHDANVATYLRDPEAPLPLVYLSFPAAKDPDFERRYPGHATLEAVTLAPYEHFARFAGTRWKKRGEDYEAIKARVVDRLLDAVRAALPKAGAAIAHAELSTPLTTEHFAAHPHGAIYGLEHSPVRFEQRALRPKTRIPGLYLTGSDICSAGVAGALMGGVLTASAITGRNVLSTIAKGAPRATAPRPGAHGGDRYRPPARKRPSAADSHGP
jgi:all-trans-retinol 13,14-reductase